MNDENEILARLERCKMPPPSKELKLRVLNDAKAAMKRELEAEKASDVKGCIKFLLACAAAFAALLVAAGVIADLIAKAPAGHNGQTSSSQVELMAKALDLQPDESLARRMAILERMNQESRSTGDTSSLISLRSALEQDIKS